MQYRIAGYMMNIGNKNKPFTFYSGNTEESCYATLRRLRAKGAIIKACWIQRKKKEWTTWMEFKRIV